MVDREVDSVLMFNKIAPKYDFLNHMLSFGADFFWRKEFVKTIPCKKYNVIVDLASGTGDLLVQLKSLSAEKYYAIDPADEMLSIAKRKINNAVFVKSYAENIPLIDKFTDLVTVAFGIRNFSDPDKALREIMRILKPGGVLAIMELNVPKKSILSYPYLFYFDKILPYIGEKVSGDNNAYSYLNKSVIDFNTHYNLKEKLNNAGFTVRTYKELSFGVVKIIIAEKC